jgi:hypothetical protein
MTTDLVTIRGAIELVAARQARRVTLSGLRFGERLLPRVTLEGAQVGVDASSIEARGHHRPRGHPARG